MIILVSCVEQGRWVYRPQKFQSGKKIMPLGLKREHQRRFAMNLAQDEGYRSDQGMTGQELAAKADHIAVKSSTGAIGDLFEGQEDRLSEYLKAFRPVDCQVETLFAIKDEVVGLECFGHQKTFSKFFRKLVQSYALDALDWLEEGKEEKEVPAANIRRFLEGVQKAPQKTYPSLGLGDGSRDWAVPNAGRVYEWNWENLKKLLA